MWPLPSLPVNSCPVVFGLLLRLAHPLVDVSERQIQPDRPVVLPPIEVAQPRCINIAAMREAQGSGSIERVQHRRDASRIRLLSSRYRFGLRQPGAGLKSGEVCPLFAESEPLPFLPIVNSPRAFPLVRQRSACQEGSACQQDRLSSGHGSRVVSVRDARSTLPSAL